MFPTEPARHNAHLEMLRSKARSWREAGGPFLPWTFLCFGGLIGLEAVLALTQGVSLALGFLVGILWSQLGARRPQALSWGALVVVLALPVAAIFFGSVHRGLPYLNVGSLRIHATELASALAVPVSAAFLARDAYGLGGLGAVAPLLVLSSVGGQTGTWAYGVALAAMWVLAVFSTRPIEAPGGRPNGGWSLLALVPVLPIAALPTVRFAQRPPASSPEGFGVWVLEDEAAGAHARTEFVLGYLAREAGFSLVLAALATLGVGAWVVGGRALRCADLHARFLGIGVATYVLVQAGWNLAVARGWLPTPPSGVAFPFLSNGGSLAFGLAASVGFLWWRFANEPGIRPANR